MSHRGEHNFCEQNIKVVVSNGTGLLSIHSLVSDIIDLKKKSIYDISNTYFKS